MEPNVLALIAGSTVLATILGTLLAQLGSIVLHKIQRKDAKADKAEDKDDEIVASLAQIQSHLDTIDGKIDAQAEVNAQNWADNARTQILRFADEIKQGTRHTEEHFNQILECIKRYEDFCRDHPDYPNTKAVCAIKLTKQNYIERLERNDFL